MATNFRKDWDEIIVPILLKKVSETAERLSKTRGEQFSTQALFYERTEFDNEHGMVLLSTKEDIANPRMVTFTIYHGQHQDDHFYKLFFEAYTSFEQDEPIVVEFDDEMGRIFECKFFRNAESFKLRIEETYMEQVFRSPQDISGTINDYTVSVLHDIINAALNTLIEEANAITASFSHSTDDNFILDLSHERLSETTSH